MIDGQVTAGIGLAVWGFAVVGTIDNIMRPMLVGREAALHDLMILISTLGGLVVFGAVGLVLGPVVAALFRGALGHAELKAGDDPGHSRLAIRTQGLPGGHAMTSVRTKRSRISGWPCSTPRSCWRSCSVVSCLLF